MLTLPIKKKWFDLIKSGEKKEEYRALSPYYFSRLGKYQGQKIEVCLRNGYSSESPKINILCEVTRGPGKTEWGAIENENYFVLKILKTLQ
ncbi:MAG: ASCH domain-containing protein [Clostridia bacterium]|jgi:hypothetical protein|nr:ASCH domain-containing protein [Clostridia bacterium]MDD3067968.1 ASCH domain-containing protein [Acholeplasmataceae bacterium]MDD3971704.1 ASCH domain-containing protein [Clostridia bacterium]